MKFLDAVRISTGALSANKMRSGLTVLGMVIGVTAVISLLSIGRGARQTVVDRIQGIGSNLLFVQPGQASEGRVQGATTLASITLSDAAALADPQQAPSVIGVAPQTNTFAQVVAQGSNMRASVIGTTPDFQWIRNYSVASGDFISDQNVLGKSMVAVIGSSVANTLFPDQAPVGQSMRINQKPFRVIGVLEAKGGGAFGSQDNSVVIPITTAQTRLRAARSSQGSLTVDLINVQAADAKLVNEAKSQITDILRTRHKITAADDFQITSQEDILKTAGQITQFFTIFLGAIASISLLVGGIGIMNIMLVSVAERTREIGIRKAVGARRNDLLLQFLLEAVMLSLVGGLLGVALGWGGSKLLPKVSFSGQTLTSLVSPDIVLLAVSVSVAIGLFFGIYPASRAASLDPIQALRSE